METMAASRSSSIVKSLAEGVEVMDGPAVRPSMFVHPRSETQMDFTSGGCNSDAYGSKDTQKQPTLIRPPTISSQPMWFGFTCL